MALAPHCRGGWREDCCCCCCCGCCRRGTGSCSFGAPGEAGCAVSGVSGRLKLGTETVEGVAVRRLSLARFGVAATMGVEGAGAAAAATGGKAGGAGDAVDGDAATAVLSESFCTRVLTAVTGVAQREAALIRVGDGGAGLEMWSCWGCCSRCRADDVGLCCCCCCCGLGIDNRGRAMCEGRAGPTPPMFAVCSDSRGRCAGPGAGIEAMTAAINVVVAVVVVAVVCCVRACKWRREKVGVGGCVCGRAKSFELGPLPETRRR
jgi:hypothetical protein